MLARFCLARDAQPGRCGDSLARALRSEYARKFVDPDDPSSPACGADALRAGAVHASAAAARWGRLARPLPP